MPFIEIIDRALYQSDANPDVTLRLEELGLRRGLVIDLCGVDPPDSTTVKVSFASSSASPATVTVIPCAVTPGANVSVPDPAA